MLDKIGEFIEKSKKEIQFYCIQCEVEFLCDVGGIEFETEDRTPRFERPVICPDCGVRYQGAPEKFRRWFKLRRGDRISFPIFLWVLSWGITAQARVYDLYRADYPKGAFCSAIGGACASDPDLENAFFQNPAALTGAEPDWNFDGDYSPSGNTEPGMKQSNDVQETQYMAGVGWGGDHFGVGGSVTGRHDVVTSNVNLTNDQGLTQKFPLTTDASTVTLSFPFSYRVRKDFSVGIALNTLSYSQVMSGSGGVRATSSSPEGAFKFGFTLGIQKKWDRRFRFGTWFRTPMTANNTLDFHTQALSNQIDYTEDMALHYPWIWASGFSFMPWGDERTFLLDLDVIGATASGFVLGYDTFATSTGDSSLVPKGRHVVVEPRLGYRMPWSAKSRITLLTGVYYETSRYSGLGGWPHVTGGVAYKVLSWLELMAGADVGKDFTQVFLTFR